MALSTEQELVVSYRGEEHLLVNALAGTGKTESVAYRVTGLLNDGLNTSDVLVISFSNAGVRSIRDRLDSLGVRGVRVTTFDFMGVSIVAPALNVGVTDGVAQARQVLGKRGIGFSLSDIRRFLFLSSRVWSGEESGFGDGLLGVSPSVFSSALEDYDALKREEGVVDFNDVSILASRLNTTRYREIIVDEAQDTSAVHLLFLESLLADGGRIVMVGDRFQSIYGFNGVSPTLFNDYCRQWESISLTQSYRSSQPVLNEVNKIFETKLTTQVNTSGDITQVQNTRTPAKEILKQLLSSNNKHPKAILARSTNLLPKPTKLTKENNITITTIHKSKGLEFDTVGIIGAQELMTGNEEDKRLAYVALSRARKNLIIN